jgi:hypothetical protein
MRHPHALPPRRHLWLLLAAVLCVVLASSFLRAQTTSTVGFDLERIRGATVFVMQVRTTPNDLIVTCVGSGTIVSRQGLVLTNAHTVLTTPTCRGDALVIALSVTPDQPPVPKYRADLLQANAGIDLALIQITRLLDNRPVDLEALALPFVELANSEQVRLDDTLTILGYPSLGDDPVLIERAAVAGFVAEPSGGDKSWVKLTTTLPSLMSGGGAYNRFGELVGIPTTAPSANNCFTLQDTNADGLVNQSDDCVPIGEFVNTLRPSNFARPLLRAASLELSVTKLSDVEAAFAQGGAPAFANLFFAPSVGEAGQPTRTIGTLPTGSSSLYLFFDYQNMTPETTYALDATLNGIPNPQLSFAPVRWSGGRSGLWYVGTTEQVLQDGIYEFTLSIDGVAAGSRQFVVGGPAAATPTFNSLIFGLLGEDGGILGNGFVLPTSNTASASFTYQNMTDGLPWTALWYYEGVEVFRSPADNVWSGGISGSTTISISDPNGLQPGNYRLALYINAELSALSDFTIAGAAQASALPNVYANVRIVSADTATAALDATALANYPVGVANLYAIFDWERIAPNTLWTMRWSVDTIPFYERTLPWSAISNGTNFITQLTAPNGLPDGTYRMELLINNVLIASVQVQVGIGQLPLDVLDQADGVRMQGVILDAASGQGIPDVTFVLISERFSVDQFVWDSAQVYATAVTDRNGRFLVDRFLQFNAPYSVIIHAEGYLPISADGVTVDDTTENPINLTLYLMRDR